MGTNPAAAVNLFVILIGTACLNSELSDTQLTLLDSCICQLVSCRGIGYQSNNMVSL